jgi:hypothetical protein
VARTTDLSATLFSSNLVIAGALALEIHAFLEDIVLTIDLHPTSARA